MDVVNTYIGEEAAAELVTKVKQHVTSAINTEVENRNAAIASAIDALDAMTVGGTGKYIASISETDGVISATDGDIDSAVTTNSDNLITSGAVASAIDTEVTDRNNAISSAIDTEVTDRNNAISSAINTEVTDRNNAISTAIDTEVANRNSAISTAIDTEVTNRNSAISSAIDTEVTNRNSAIADEASLRSAADTALSNDIDSIEDLIPNQATTSNQLADKAFVNSTVQTNTANFRGNWPTWSVVPTAAADYPVDYAGNKTPTVNDYLVVEDASGYTDGPLSGTWRFKYTGTWSTDGKSGWLPEYQVNEEPLTSEQVFALNSGITATKVNSYDAHLSDTSNPHSVTKSQVGLGNVGNFKAVSTEASQGLTATEQANARSNIGAGTSSFSGNYNDLTGKPTIPAAQVQTDWNATSGMASIKNKPATDTTVTASSSNLITSGAVAEAIANAKYDLSIGDNSNPDTYPNDAVRIYQVKNYNIGWAGNDGFIIHIPWGGAGSYGCQIAFDDQSNWAAVRSRNQGTWTTWEKIMLSSELSSAISSAISTEVTNRNTAITNAINALDVASAGGTGKYISAISETNGKIAATAGNIDSTPTTGSNNLITSGGVAAAISDAAGIDMNDIIRIGYATCNDTVSNFYSIKKAVYYRDMLVGITADKVLYSHDDGQNWSKAVDRPSSSYIFTDIILWCGVIYVASSFGGTRTYLHTLNIDAPAQATLTLYANVAAGINPCLCIDHGNLFIGNSTGVYKATQNTTDTPKVYTSSDITNVTSIISIGSDSIYSSGGYHILIGTKTGSYIGFTSGSSCLKFDSTKNIIKLVKDKINNIIYGITQTELLLYANNAYISIYDTVNYGSGSLQDIAIYNNLIFLLNNDTDTNRLIYVACNLYDAVGSMPIAHQVSPTLSYLCTTDKYLLISMVSIPPKFAWLSSNNAGLLAQYNKLTSLVPTPDYANAYSIFSNLLSGSNFIIPEDSFMYVTREDIYFGNVQTTKDILFNLNESVSNNALCINIVNYGSGAWSANGFPCFLKRGTKIAFSDTSYDVYVTKIRFAPVRYV